MTLSLLSSARSSLLFSNLLWRSTRCLRNFSLHDPTPATRMRSVVIKNLPPTFSFDKLHTLKGVGRPVESIYRHPQKNQVEIRYLQRSDASMVVDAGRNGELAMDGQTLEAMFVKSDPLGVEVLSSIGLLTASRKLTFENIPEQFTVKEKLQEEMSRFGEVQEICIEDGQHTSVTFSDIMTAVKANRMLGTEEVWKDFPSQFDSSIYGIHSNQYEKPPEHRTVVLKYPTGDHHRRFSPRALIQILTKMPLWLYGEPLLRLSVIKGLVFLQFCDQQRAEAFFTLYNPPPGIQKTWATSESYFSAGPVVATRLGATRTLAIRDFDDPRVNLGRVNEDFSQFGEIADIRLDLPSRRAFVEYIHIKSAFEAISHIYQNNRSFGVYAGSTITFGRHRAFRATWAPLRSLQLLAVKGQTSDSKP